VIGKDATPDEVATAIRIVAAGRPVLPSSVQQTLLLRQSPPPGPAELSPREVEVVRLMAEGFNNTQIAERLGAWVPIGSRGG
jgi:two-component system capsular synthesis response regulator RcsB